MKRYITILTLCILCLCMTGCMLPQDIAGMVQKDVESFADATQAGDAAEARQNLLNSLLSAPHSEKTEEKINNYLDAIEDATNAGQSWTVATDKIADARSNPIIASIPGIGWPKECCLFGAAQEWTQGHADAEFMTAWEDVDEAWAKVEKAIAKDEEYQNYLKEQQEADNPANQSSAILPFVIGVVVVLAILILLLMILKKKKAPKPVPMPAPIPVVAPDPVTASQYHKINITDDGHMRLLREACAKTGKDPDYYLTACGGDIEKAYYMANSESMGFVKED